MADAVEQVTKELQINPSGSKYLQRAKLYLKDESKNEEAIEDFRKAMALGEKDEQMYFVLGSHCIGTVQMTFRYLLND